MGRARVRKVSRSCGSDWSSSRRALYQKRCQPSPGREGLRLQYVGCCARQPCAPLLVSGLNHDAIFLYGNDLTTQVMAGRVNQSRLSCREETSRSPRRPQTQVDTAPQSFTYETHIPKVLVASCRCHIQAWKREQSAADGHEVHAAHHLPSSLRRTEQKHNFGRMRHQEHHQKLVKHEPL